MAKLGKSEVDESFRKHASSFCCHFIETYAGKNSLRKAPAKVESDIESCGMLILITIQSSECAKSVWLQLTS